MNVKTVLSSIESVLCQETEGDDLFIAEHISEKVGEVLVNCRELLQRFESVEMFLAEFAHLEDVIVNFDDFTKSREIHLSNHDEIFTRLDFESEHLNYGFARLETSLEKNIQVTMHHASFRETSISADDTCSALTALSKLYFITSLIFSPNETDEVAIKHLLEKANEKPNQ